MKFTYKVIRSSRKSLALQVDKDCNIIVRAPYFVSQKHIDEFIVSKKPWLEKAVASQLEKLKSRKDYTEEEIDDLRNKAKRILPEKVEYYSKLMGVKPSSMKINSAKTRFGSCSSVNNINFSLFLMDKDERFINYVVIHELAHTVHHNHSKAFYDLISRYMPDYKEISKMYR